MRYEVLLTAGAERDIEEIHQYIAEHDSPVNADRVLDRLTQAFESLEAHPERGSYPKELVELGIREFRQIYFKPYRLIYRVGAPKVYVYVIVDGRRDMQTLLARRLLTHS